MFAEGQVCLGCGRSMPAQHWGLDDVGPSDGQARCLGGRALFSMGQLQRFQLLDEGGLRVF